VSYVKNRVREFRSKHGLSQTALAEAVGTTKRTIYAIEVENKDIHVSLAHKLAARLGCGVDDLFDFEDGSHSTARKAVWFARVVRHTAEEMEMTVGETIKLFEKTGLAGRIISGYDVWHTQGYEYMAEMLSELLTEKLEVQEV
jgi:DNA-binding XRE family transcriptional regulator